VAEAAAEVAEVAAAVAEAAADVAEVAAAVACVVAVEAELEALVALAAEEVALPSQSGNNGKYLTTNGSTASWAAIVTDPTPSIFMLMGA